MPHALPHVRLLAAALAALAATCSPAADAAMGTPSTAGLQVGLKARGFYAGTIHGHRNPATRSALAAFQRRVGLRPDGVSDPATRDAFGAYGRYRLGSRSLRLGTRGWDVAGLQFLLAWHGFPSGTLDGDFGPRTEAALNRYKTWRGLRVDGVARPGTIRLLRTEELPTVSGSVRRPVAASLSDDFGPRGSRFHAGLDFAARSGAPVVAARRGVVVFAGWDSGGYGNLVVVRHRAGVRSYYAHLSAIRARRGRTVVAGGRLGSVGATGSATGPHLHFELRTRGAAVDPPPFR